MFPLLSGRDAVADDLVDEGNAHCSGFIPTSCGSAARLWTRGGGGVGQCEHRLGVATSQLRNASRVASVCGMARDAAGGALDAMTSAMYSTMSDNSS